MSLLNVAVNALKLQKKLSPWQWVEKHLVISPRQPSPIHGRISTAVTPWIRGWMDAYIDPTVNTIVIEKSAQSSATFTALCLQCFNMVNSPGPSMYVMDSEDNAKSLSETRLMPLIEDSPIVAQELPDDKDDYKKLEYKLKRSTLRFVGANSAGKLASRPIQYLFEDEVEKYKEKLGREGSVVSLAEQRTKTFFNRKIWKCSSPTTTDGHIHLAFIAGDQRRFFVPCHSCGAMQWLKWDQVKFNSKLEPQEAGKTAVYECEQCKVQWTNTQKNNAVQKGEWRATTKSKQAGVASFHISSLYGPWDSCSLEVLTTKFLSVKDNPAELQDFINSDLGEAWEEQRIVLPANILDDRKTDYVKGQFITEKESFKTAYKDKNMICFLTADVQKYAIWWLVRAWFQGGDSALVDWGYVHAFEDVNALADKYHVKYVLIDSGYGERTTEVYKNCLAFKFLPVKGMSTRSVLSWTQTSINVLEGQRGQRQAGPEQILPLIQHDTITFKLQLNERIKGLSPFAWYVPHDITSDYTNQILSEEYVNGEWKLRRGSRDNHLWDCEVMQLLGATMCGYERKIMK